MTNHADPTAELFERLRATFERYDEFDYTTNAHDIVVVAREILQAYDDQIAKRLAFEKLMMNADPITPEDAARLMAGDTGPGQIDQFVKTASASLGPEWPKAMRSFAIAPETSRDEIGAGDECKTEKTTKPMTHWLPAGHPLIGHRAVESYEVHPSGITDITLRFKTAEDWTELPSGYRTILQSWVAAQTTDIDPGLLASATLCIDARNRTCYIREVTIYTRENAKP